MTDETKCIRPRSIGLGLVELMGGTLVTEIGGSVVYLARQAPLLEKPFEPTHLITYGIGTAGAMVAVLGLVTLYDGIKILKENYFPNYTT
ncbi:MAG: hypothetical protein QT02_C0002G0040 [archaeon GW2011_AR9]|nr:MAG: hypothetical protein QT02_C0002G0040 [archaeon GW2011_AR9]MBS3120583.1 hypothetical protein [Candidatus Woesearchaeota archaeon]HIG93659.1 hypothetical protein [Candidatus Woesearchaeota archaeon]HIH12507.1 hypothetical protein [Candidatus Woesearchaeota archaeon]